MINKCRAESDLSIFLLFNQYLIFCYSALRAADKILYQIGYITIHYYSISIYHSYIIIFWLLLVRPYWHPRAQIHTHTHTPNMGIIPNRDRQKQKRNTKIYKTIYLGVLGVFRIRVESIIKRRSPLS